MEPTPESVYQILSNVEKSGGSCVVCTIIRSKGSTPRHVGSKMIVYSDGSFTGTVGGGEVESRVRNEAMQAMKDGSPKILSYEMVDPSRGDPGICGGQLEVYLEPVLPPPAIVIIGGGHVGKAVAHLARWLNFQVIVSDDREEFCTPETNPDADQFYPVSMKDLPSALTIHPQMYLILTTRGATVDIEGLPALLTSPAAYIGVIGSKRRWATTRKGLLESGVSEEMINRVHSPIGIELNAETPEEIAVSIMAEILMIRDGGTGKSMKADF